MDGKLLARVEKQAWFHRYPRGMPFALFVIGMVITLLFVFNLVQADRTANELALDRDSNALAADIDRKVSENVAYLNAAASLFSVSDQVSQEEFGQFVADLSAGYQGRGALGIGWARWLKGSEVDAFEAEQRAGARGPGFAVRPRPLAPDSSLAIVTLLEPQTDRNVAAFGFDMYAESLRRQAMDQAAQTGRAVATAKVHLVQDRGDMTIAGVLIYMPVYSWAYKDGTRMRGPLRGFVYSPVRLPDFLKAVLADVRHDEACVALYDGLPAPQNLMANSDCFDSAQPNLTRDIEFAGRRWSLVVTSPAHVGLGMTAWVVLLLGSVVSLLVMALAWLVTSRAADDRRVLEWLREQAAIRTSLTRELNHRVKNTLANVLSIVALTRRRTRNIDDFADGLNGRIRALSATHDLLSARDWSDAPINDVVTSELAPYLDPEDPHADVSGPDVLLAPNDALSLGLALHELATNAAKYGALSTPDGRVSVTWAMIEGDKARVRWAESGGPTVVAPDRRGFGLELIEKIVSHELGTRVDLQFAPEGVTCEMEIQVRNLGGFAMRQATG